MQEVYVLYFSVFKQEKPLSEVHSSEVNKAKSKWKALLARLSHNPHTSATLVSFYPGDYSKVESACALPNSDG